MNIYIAGAITGHDIEQRKQAFEEGAARALRYLEPEIQIINPFSLDHYHGKSWREYMEVCINALVRCDGIYMLPCWTNSKGARLELQVAEGLGLKRYFERGGGVQHHYGETKFRQLEPRDTVGAYYDASSDDGLTKVLKKWAVELHK